MNFQNPTFPNDSNAQEYISSENVFFSHCICPHPTQVDPLAFKFYRHTSEQHQILIFLSGECEMRTDDYTRNLQPGDVCFNPALSFYGVHIMGDAPYERVVIHFPPNPLFDKLAKEVFDDLKPINVNIRKYLLPYIERYKEYSTQLPLRHFSAFSNILVQELLYICMMEKSRNLNTSDASEPLLKQALAYINSNWMRIKSIKEVSNHLFISPSYLYEIFNKKLGFAPKTYLMQKRLNAAHAYLISGMSPYEVSQQVGFNTYTAFYRACKAFYGKTPQEIWAKKGEVQT